MFLILHVHNFPIMRVGVTQNFVTISNNRERGYVGLRKATQFRTTTFIVSPYPLAMKLVR